MFAYQEAMEEEQASIEQVAFFKEKGYMDLDGEPLKCWHCEGGVKEIVTDKIDFMVVEKDKVCSNKECGKLLGSWVYGYWQD